MITEVFHFDVPAVFEQDLMEFILEHVEDKMVEPLLEVSINMCKAFLLPFITQHRMNH